MDFYVFKQCVSKSLASKDDKRFTASINIKSKKALEIKEFYERFYAL
jgi:hypothetical protein